MLRRQFDIPSLATNSHLKLKETLNEYCTCHESPDRRVRFGHNSGRGLSIGHVFLLEGNPGAGKTTIALQFLIEGARLGEQGLYITLSETESELRAGAASHGMVINENIEVFELVPPESLLDADQQQSLLYSSDLELGESTREIFAAFERVRPSRVVLDSLSEIRLLAQSSLRYRRQILALKHYFARQGATVLLLDDLTSDTLDKTVHSVVHGVIHLDELAPSYGSERRRLRVTKYRGQGFRGGYHDFTIQTGGVVVFPRLVAAEHRTSYVRDQLSSGVAGMDLLLGGGLERGSSTLILGPAGTGKSTFSFQFVMAAIARGEKAAVFIFDEELGLLFTRLKQLGMDLEALRNEGLLHIEQLDAAELSPGEFAHRVCASVDSSGAKTVVIDSINGYQASMPDENSLILHMHELLQYLNRQGANTFLTVAQHGLVGDMNAPVDVTYLADTVILLRYFEAAGKVRRAVSVIKKRTGFHEDTIREYRIDASGLRFGDPLVGFQGCFVGFPNSSQHPLRFCQPTTRTAAISNFPNPKALIYAPAGRDAQVAASLTDQAGLPSIAVADLKNFAASLDEEIAVGVLTEEAVRGGDLTPIAAWVAAQPSWSDLPFIVLTSRGGGPERNPAAARLSEVLGNVTFLERPFHATSFISVARTALKGRLRQYEARARLEALGEGERRLQTALAAGRLGAWELELSTMALSASATCKAVFGRGPDDEVTRDDLIASIHPDDRELVLTRLRQTVDTGRDYSIEHRTIWPDGSLHWTEVHAQLYADRYGSASKLVGVCSDTTVRKTIEENLRRLNETLEERVRERTREVNAAHQTLLEEVAQRERAEEQLRQSQKMEAIGQLTGGVAHDFNNLLMVVLGNLELLGKHLAGDTRATRLVDGAIQGARRGAALTQRLLAFARQQDLQVKPVDLAALVSGMNDLLRRSVGSSISIETNLPARLPPALIDANQLELALLNLAVNARDAMPDGGTLSISLREEQVVGAGGDLGDGAYLVLAVVDSGTGMDAETLKKAVDPFFSTKELGKGTGLGLSMIHGLAVQLNGALFLTSELGVGTTAELWLPATERRPERPAETELPVPQSASRLKILLVDDDALIAMSSVDMLEDLGHEVVETNSGAAALELIKNGQHFDLMITDYSMPGMTGAQLTEAVRDIHPTLPIVLATGYADLPAGTDIDIPRLGKPYNQAQLTKEIAKALARETAPVIGAISARGSGSLFKADDRCDEIGDGACVV